MRTATIPMTPASGLRRGPAAFPSAADSVAKRVLDVVLASIAVVMFLPFLIGIVAMMKAQMPGPVLFGHERVGARGRRFRCWKFRTMYVDAPEILREHLARDPFALAEWEETQKLRDDPRITPLGKVMRKLSIDELPQLINVITGEMSLVGPRPVVPDELDRYGLSTRHYLGVRPGVTGLWQVSGRSETSYSRRVALDRYYAMNRTLILDFRIMAETIPAVVASRGAY